MRGGASDLYGSSAIGGVIDVLPVEPGERLQYTLHLTGAQENTSIVSGLLAGTRKGWSALGATTLFRTGGYVLTAPEARGPARRAPTAAATTRSRRAAPGRQPCRNRSAAGCGRAASARRAAAARRAARLRRCGLRAWHARTHRARCDRLARAYLADWADGSRQKPTGQARLRAKEGAPTSRGSIR